MAISRGSIHHSLIDDLNNLLVSIFGKPFNLSAASPEEKRNLSTKIEDYYCGQNATLFPFARTAFYAILKSLSLPPGSTILLTPFNIYPMLDIIHALGYKPLFVDIDLQDFGPVEDDLIFHLQQKPACFLMTYLFGSVPNVSRIAELCHQYSVPLIEDISQNIGSKHKGKYLGTFGIASIYSASLTKYVDAYNGAFALTANDSIASSLQQFALSKLVPTSKPRLRLVIAKTFFWNLLLNLSVFSVLTLPLLKLLKFFSPTKFESLLGPSIRKTSTLDLPRYYFEDIAHIQCQQLGLSLSRLNHLIKLRRSAAKKASLAFFGYVDETKNQQSTFWQFICPVKNVSEARALLFQHGIETGTTNLPDLSSGFFDISLPNSKRLKSTQLFIPLHKQLRESDYLKIAMLLRSKNLLINT